PTTAITRTTTRPRLRQRVLRLRHQTDPAGDHATHGRTGLRVHAEWRLRKALLQLELIDGLVGLSGNGLVEVGGHEYTGSRVLVGHWKKTRRCRKTALDQRRRVSLNAMTP